MFRGIPDDAKTWFPGFRQPYEDGFGIKPALLHPDSRGEVLLRSKNPADHVRIFFNFLSAPNDLPTLREGFKIGRDVAYQAPLDPFRGEELEPGPDVKTDDEIEDFIRGNAETGFHPSGTCRMGSGSNSVVDNNLKVHGIEGLRIADASIFPTIPSGNTNAACIMVGEKTAEIIKNFS